ncbi:ABC transporter substrate-binding protein [Pseudoruegeria sp. HB172150]|uniref:ABC transporter substrate-binding protein n=1 Tax=Pseudoruegeria sp. HB172150 TaxID=2721164 RepID=UPI001558072A|nr:ABC transporter substrate-binding protein [Pseudoruegeria sp. HB172150]
MITRRDFGKYSAGAGALTLAAGAKPLYAQDRPTLTIAVDNLWANINTINGISTSTRRFFPNIYSLLVEQDYINDPNGVQLKPGLATEWSRDGKVWTIKLREGVKFHDGTTMTAEDVAFTLGPERLWGDEPFEPRGKTFTEGFVRVEAVDDLTVEIETDKVDPYIPGKLTGYIGFVVPKAAYLEMGVDAFGQMPIGTGPYKVTKFDSGEVLEIEAFDEYWDGPPPAAKVIWKIVPEFAARMAGVVSGEFDFMYNIPTDQMSQLESYDNVTVAYALAGNYPAVGFNCLPDPEDNPLVDVRLRKALVQSVDMDAIVTALFGELTYHPEVPFNWTEYGPFYDPDMPNPLPYDPEAAKALIAETDYDGEELDWHITRQFYPNYEAAAEIMVEMWREVGLNVKANVLDNFQLVYERPWHMQNFSNSTAFIPGDPYRPLWLDWGPASGRAREDSRTRTWEPTPEYLAAGEKFLNAVEFEERKEAYLELSAAWQEVTPCMYLWKSVYNWAHRADVTWVPRPDGEMRMFGEYLTLPA